MECLALNILAADIASFNQRKACYNPANFQKIVCSIHLAVMPRGYLRHDDRNSLNFLLLVLCFVRFDTVCTSCKPGSVNEPFAVVADSSRLLRITIPSGAVSILDDAEMDYFGAGVSPDGVFCLASIQKKDQSFAIKLIYLGNNSYIYPHYKQSTNPSFDAFFGSPKGISFATNGTFALVAETSGKIRMIDITKGLVVPSIAGPVTGDGIDFRDGPGVSATFNYPVDVQISPDGIYALVADMANHRIRKIDLSSLYIVSTLAGSSQGYVDGSQALFSFPSGIAISPDGIFALVADSSNHAIRKISLSGSAVTNTIAGGSQGFADGPNSRFFYPKGICIAFDGKYAIVSDSQNHKIRAINLATNDVSTLGGPTQAISFINPQLIAIAPPGTCSLCQQGTYSASASCTMCKIGTYSSSIGAADDNSCVLCPAGKASSQLGASDISFCTSCLDGEFAAEGSSACSQCSAGKFSLKQSKNCTFCAAGKFSVSNGSSFCSNCLKGTFSTRQGVSSASDCDSCQVGKFSTAEGADNGNSCTSCEVGKYLLFGTVSCVGCAAGKFSSSLTATDPSNCSACNAGYYATVVSATSEHACMLCEAGTYSNVAGTACTSCAPGAFSEVQAIQCSTCSMGTYSSFPAASTCLICMPGTFSQTGGSICSLCGVGQYNSGNGADSCRICEAGTFSSLSGSTMCSLCVAGAFSTSGICELCASGKFVSSDGASTCESCSQGKFVSARGSRNEGDCLDCGQGYYYSRLGVDAPGMCLACERGKYSTNSTSTACKVCSVCQYGMEVSRCNSSFDAVCDSPNADILIKTSRYIFAFGPMPVSACVVLTFLKVHSVPLLSNFRWFLCIYAGANDVLSNFALLVLLNYDQQVDIFWILLGPMVIYFAICFLFCVHWKEQLLLIITSSTDVKPKFQRSMAITNKVAAICLTSVPSLIVQIWLLIQFLSMQTHWLNWLICIESVFFTFMNLGKNIWDLRRLCSFDAALWEAANASTSFHTHGDYGNSLAGGNEFSRIGDNDESSKDSFSEPTSVHDQEAQYLSPIRDRRNLDIGGIGDISIQLEPVTEFNESFDDTESSFVRTGRTPKKLNFSSKLDGDSLYFTGRSPFEPDFEHAAEVFPGRNRRTDIPLVAEETSPSKRKAE